MNREAFANFGSIFLLALAIHWYSPGHAAPPTGDKIERRYQQGPLKAEDFRGSPSSSETGRARGADFSAFLDTAVRWTFRFKSEKRSEKGREIFVVEAAEIDVYSTMLPNSSFNLKPHDHNLLDHEQGHFDIAEIYTLEVKIKLLEMLHRGEISKFKANTEAEGAEKLRSELQRLIEQTKDSLMDRQRQYDEKTDHGNRASAQKQAREGHRAQLNALQERLRVLESKKIK